MSFVAEIAERDALQSIRDAIAGGIEVDFVNPLDIRAAPVARHLRVGQRDRGFGIFVREEHRISQAETAVR